MHSQRPLRVCNGYDIARFFKRKKRAKVSARSEPACDRRHSMLEGGAQGRKATHPRTVPLSHLRDYVRARYLEYAPLAGIKREILAAGLDPRRFFRDLGPVFRRRDAGRAWAREKAATKAKARARSAASAALWSGVEGLASAETLTDMRFADFLVPTNRMLWLGTGDTVAKLHFDRQVRFWRGTVAFMSIVPSPRCHIIGCLFQTGTDAKSLSLSSPVGTGEPDGGAAGHQDLHALPTHGRALSVRGDAHALRKVRDGSEGLA